MGYLSDNKASYGFKGFIKLHRSLLDWEWYDDHNTTRLLIHLLCSVNYTDKKWRGTLIKAGSMVTSFQNLAVQSSLTIQQVRTSIKKLEKSGELTRQATNKYQLLTLTKWDKLQIKKEESTSKPTGKQQPNNNQITTTKEGKELKERKELDLRESNFKKEVLLYTQEYDLNLLESFFLYWSEPNRSGTKMRFEQQKTWSTARRLKAWKRNESKFGGSETKLSSRDSLQQAYLELQEEKKRKNEQFS